MLIRIGEPALGPGLDWGCEPPGAKSAFGAVELVVRGAAASEPAALGSVLGVAGLELAGAAVTSVWAGARSQSARPREKRISPPKMGQ